MSFEGRIRPFQFDRDFTGTLSPRSFSAAELQQEVEELKARLATTEADLDVRLAAAREDGFSAGLAHARADQQMALLAALDALQAAVETTDAEMSDIRASLLDGAADLALAAAEQLAALSLAAEPTAPIHAAIEKAAAEAGLDARLRIQLNPADATVVETSASHWTLRTVSIDVVPDPAIGPGDARISWGTPALVLDQADRRARVQSAISDAIAAARAGA
jgi:flagellar assembly protein FliH